MFKKTIFAERIKFVRLSKGYTQESLANALEATKPYISGLELGRRTTTLEKLVELADLLDVSLDFLTGRTDNPNSHKK